MLKNLLIYSAGIFFSKVLVFFLIPIYTHYLAPSEYGYYDVLIGTMQLLVSIAFIEIWNGVLRYMFDYEYFSEKINVVKSVLYMTVPLLAFMLCGLLLISFIVEIRFFAQTILYIISYAFLQTLQGVARGFEKNRLYVISGVVATLVSCLLSIYFVVFLGKGVSFILTALVVGNIVALAILFNELNIVALLKNAVVDYAICKEIFIFCLPLLLNTIAYTFLDIFDKNYLLDKLGEDQIAYYAVASKFAAIIAVVASIYQLAWQEYSFRYANSENKDEIYTLSVNTYLKFMGLSIPIAVVLVSLTFDLLIGGAYRPALVLVPLAMLTAFVGSVSGVLGNLFAVIKKSKYFFVTTLAGAVVNIILLVLLTPIILIQAINVSLFCGFLVISIYRFKVVSSYMCIILNKQVILMIGFTSLIAFLPYIFPTLLMHLCSLLFLLGVWYYINRDIITSLINALKIKIGELFKTRIGG
jgi:O-antigen/teichoic acid export membrane protein